MTAESTEESTHDFFEAVHCWARRLMDLQGGPTFEDLSIDDELTQLQRLVRYSSSSIALQRLVHVKVRRRHNVGPGLPWHMERPLLVQPSAVHVRIQLNPPPLL